MANKLSTLAVMFPYQAATAGVTVRVAVSYLAEQSDPSAGRWFWSYHIRIENGADKAVQLLSRRWHIVDGRGAEHEVIGEVHHQQVVVGEHRQGGRVLGLFGWHAVSVTRRAPFPCG